MLTQEGKINVELMNKIMTENKTTSPFLRNEDLKEIKIEAWKLNIPIGNINELNKQIYAGAKLVCDKIDVPRRNPSRNIKPGWVIRLEGQVNYAKIVWGWKDQNKTTDKSDNTTWRDKSKDIDERKET